MTAQITLLQLRGGGTPSAHEVDVHGAVQGTLALDWSPSSTTVEQPAPRLTVIDYGTDPAVSVVATPRDELPEPRRWTAQLVQAVVEVLADERPRQQLVRWLSPSIYADLSAAVLARSTPGKNSTNRARRSVSSVHICEPADGIVEATAVIIGGARARAVALRLEGWDGRWRCTRLAIL
jgi:hypothetical protein